MSPLVEAIQRIINWVQTNRPADASCLNPGLTHWEIENMTKDLPFQFPEELYEIYQWSNGVKPTFNYGYIFDSFALLPLEEAIEIYQKRLNPLDIYWSYKNKSYESNWFQIFFCYISEVAGYIVINENSQCHLIFEYEKDHQEIRQYTSLTSVMQTLAECYERGYYSAGVYVDFEKIWRKYNSSIFP